MSEDKLTENPLLEECLAHLSEIHEELDVHFSRSEEVSNWKGNELWYLYKHIELMLTINNKLSFDEVR